MKPLFVTTPIYYANANVHGWNAYWSFTADIIARIWRLMGRQVKFCTWTDENGQKMTEAAHAVWKEVMEFLDDVAKQQRKTRDTLSISYTDFIRTTHPTHKKHVQSMLQKSYDSGDVYQWEYEWLYCVWCEAFKKESDLIEQDGNLVCTDHLKPPQKISEKNWFFKLSSYEEFLKDFYTMYPNFCLPKQRFSEVKSFVNHWLDDFSISRQWSSFGIPIPFDETSVSYIWYDALFNYHTVCKYPSDFTINWQSISWDIDDIAFWEDSEIVHCLWKDIVRFHAIYWPAMLESVWLRQPDHEVVTWFFTIDGQKMSKSLGNIIDPVATVEQYGRDAFVYYLFSDINVWNDWDFSRERLTHTKDSMLKKWWWNLVARTVTLARKIELKKVNQSSVWNQEFQQFLLWEASVSTVVWSILVWEKGLESLKEYGYEGHTQILTDRYQLIKTANKRIDTNKPRELVTSNPEKAVMILEQLMWWIKWCAVLSSPFLIEWYEAVKSIVVVDHIDRKRSSTSVWWTDWQSLIDLQEFDITLWEWKYIY